MIFDVFAIERHDENNQVTRGLHFRPLTGDVNNVHSAERPNLVLCQDVADGIAARIVAPEGSELVETNSGTIVLRTPAGHIADARQAITDARAGRHGLKLTSKKVV